MLFFVLIDLRVASVQSPSLLQNFKPLQTPLAVHEKGTAALAVPTLILVHHGTLATGPSC